MAYKIFLILRVVALGGGILLGISTSLFAAGGGYPSGDGNNNVKASGKWYRCFANIGHTLSYLQNNSQWVGHAKYCLPKYPTHCKKDWDWSLDPKDDTASETEASKKCQPNTCKDNGGGNSSNAHVFVNGAGRQTPVETYYYCVYGNDWDKVAKCIDKSTGDNVPNSLCDKDATGANYYYKPRCDADDTKESCNAKLDKITKTLTQGFGWRFCYQPPEGGKSNVVSYYRNAGGQSVKFKEFINDKGTKSGPCEQGAISLSGGNAPEEEPDEPLGTLVIIDWDDNRMGVSKVHTKISMQAADFKLYTEAGKIGSGIQSATCEVTGDGTSYKGNAGSKFSFGSLWAFKFSAPKEAFPKSGEYKIKCDGVGKDGKSVSAEVGFFVAPKSYQFGVVNAVFNNTTSAQSSGGVVTENIIDKAQIAEFGKTTTAPTHDNQNWTKKPVVKISELLTLQVNEITAQTASGTIDSGVDGKNSIGGTISMDTNESKVNPRAITDATKIPPTTSAASGACVVAPTIATNDAEMIGGTMTNLETIATIQADNALLANAEVLIYDTAMHAKIKEQEGIGLCNDSAKFPCPYPAKLKTIFDYQVAPNNFKAELLDKNNNPLKVLYFGQGNSPLADSATKIRVSALRADDKIAKDFNTNCAAQDMTLNMELSGQGFSIKVIDKDGKDFVIKGSEFKDGIANVEGILQVNKDKDIPFTPNMKSEPVFTQDKYPNGFPANMEFAGFPPTSTYYPNYKDVSVNPNNPLMILRGRINAIDTDNNATNFGIASPTKVYYEFQCEYCDLDKVAKVTGWARYGVDDKSPTQQGWFIDRTFDKYNESKVESSKAEIENLGNAQIKAVSGVTNGFQDIAYSFLGVGTYKLNIRHGNFKDAMPYFLLYNAYWTGSMKKVQDKDGNTAQYLESGTKWNTSAFIHIKGAAKDEARDYGVDTGGAKNTRSGGRIGRY